MNESYQKIRDAHVAIERVAREQSASSANPLRERQRLAGELRAAWNHLGNLQRLERERFAESRGWRVYGGTQGWIYTSQLVAGRMLINARDVADYNHSVIDHREGFVGWPPDVERKPRACRYPVAILSHTYGEWQPCVDFAERHGLKVEPLPWSWYHPTRCIAALFTRRA